MSWRWWLERKARDLKTKIDASEKAANREYETDEHGTPRVVRKFEYKNFGEKQNLLAFGTLAAFLSAFVMGQKADNYAHDQFKLLGRNPPPVTEEYKALVKVNESKPEVDTDKLGRYLYRIDYQQGHTLNGDVEFSTDNIIYKSILIGESMSMRGFADFKVVGSVLKYSDVQGDKYLFNEYGDILDVKSSDEIAFLYENGQSLPLFEIGTSIPFRSMVVKDDRSLMQIILAAHYTAQLQLLSLLVGILLTIYMVTKITMQWVDNVKNNKARPLLFSKRPKNKVGKNGPDDIFKA